MSNLEMLEMKVDALMRLVASEDGPTYDKAKAEVLRLMQDEQPSGETNVDEEIANALLELGMPQHILGYRYNLEAVKMAVMDAEILNSFTKEFYPAIAEVYGTTPSRAERAIRHAIETAWSRCDIDVMYKYFGNTVSPLKGKPTNSEFIARIADHIRRQMKRSKAVS